MFIESTLFDIDEPGNSAKKTFKIVKNSMQEIKFKIV